MRAASRPPTRQRQRRLRSCAVAVGMVLGAALSTLGTQLAHAESTLLAPSLDWHWPWSWQPDGQIDWAPDWPDAAPHVSSTAPSPEA